MASFTRVSAALRGFLIPDSRIPDGYSSTSSSVTQAGPRPGSAVPDDALSELVLQASGEQSDNYTVKVLEAGMPGIDKLRATYRKTSGAASTARGWNPPNLITGWSAVTYQPSGTATWTGAKDIAVIPSTQKLVMSCVVTAGADDGDVQVYTYDPFTATLGSAVTLPQTATQDAKNTAICVLPGSERILVYVRDDAGFNVYYSDDDAATFALYSRNVLSSEPGDYQGVRSRLRYMPSGDLALVHIVDDAVGDRHIYQYASNDLGTTFTLVDEWTMTGSDTEGPMDVVVTRGGRLGVAYIADTSNLIKWRSVGSAWEVLESATDVAVHASFTADELSCFVDHDGAIYIIARALAAETVELFRSTDEGATWEQFTFGVWDSDGATSTYPKYYATICAAGSTWLLHGWNEAVGDEGQSVGLMRLGGWSNLTTAYTATTSRKDTARIAWGPEAVTGTTVCWAPFDEPGDAGWTATGAGTDTLTAGYLNVSTSASLRYYEPPTSLGTATFFMGMAELKVNSVTGGSTVDRIAFRVGLANGVASYDASVRFTDTQIIVYDHHGTTTVATVNYDTTTPFQIFFGMEGVVSGNRLEVLYRRPYETTWSVAAQTDSLTDGGAVANGYWYWGNIVSGTADSDWRLVVGAYGLLATEGWNAGVSTATDHDDIIGKALTTHGYPLGDTATAGATFLRAIDGPGRVNESHSIPIAYDYPIDAIHYTASPSPRVKWRTTADSADAEIVWTPDSSAASWLGNTSIAVFLGGINFDEASLQGKVGAGAWATLGTYYASNDFSGIAYTRSGNTVRCDTSSATKASERYVHRGEFVGGSIEMGGGVVRKILSHTEGLWPGIVTGTSPKLATFTIEITGGEPASGNCAIRSPSGVLIIHNVTTKYDSFRLLIPAQDTAENYFSAGLIMLGAFQPVGKAWDWGWTATHEPNAEALRSASGTLRVRKRGPVLPQRTMAWPTAASDLTALFDKNPQFISPKAAYEGLVNEWDTTWLMSGLLEDLKSGEIPVVLLPSVPDASSADTHIITDPDLWFYGRITSSVSIENVLGDEGSNELQRLQAITVEGIV